jgi:hypothetical protein
MSDKKVSVIYSKDGERLKTVGLADDQKQKVRDMFDRGERDPSVMLDQIE